MGKLATYRDKRANLRAHTSALKKTARTEAKLAAEETRKKAKEAHRVELAETKERAKLARKNADRKAKREAKRAQRQDKLAEKATKRDRKAESALSKNEQAALKREAKLRSKDRKQADKIDSAGRKHEEKLAAMELDKIEAGKLGKKDVQRWLDLAKVATPVVLPMIYKVASNVQGSSAADAGSVDLKAAGINATGPGAALGARIVRLEQTLAQLDTDRGSERQVKEFVAASRSRLKDLRSAVEAAESTPTAKRREIHSSISGELDRVNKDILARLGVRA